MSFVQIIRCFWEGLIEKNNWGIGFLITWNKQQSFLYQHLCWRDSKESVFWRYSVKKMCQSLFFNKVAGLLKKTLGRKCFPVNFEKFLRTLLLTRHLRWLLLIQSHSLDRVPLTALIITNAALYWTDSTFWWKEVLYKKTKD